MEIKKEKKSMYVSRSYMIQKNLQNWRDIFFFCWLVFTSKLRLLVCHKTARALPLSHYLPALCPNRAARLSVIFTLIGVVWFVQGSVEWSAFPAPIPVWSVCRVPRVQWLCLTGAFSFGFTRQPFQVAFGCAVHVRLLITQCHPLLHGDFRDCFTQ